MPCSLASVLFMAGQGTYVVNNTSKPMTFLKNFFIYQKNLFIYQNTYSLEIVFWVMFTICGLYLLKRLKVCGNHDFYFSDQIGNWDKQSES